MSALAETAREVAAEWGIELGAGDGAVPLLRNDRERRALLLGRAWPGDDLGSLDEDEAAAVGRRLWHLRALRSGGSETMSHGGSTGRRTAPAAG